MTAYLNQGKSITIIFEFTGSFLLSLNRSLENGGYSFQFLSPFTPKSFHPYVRIITKVMETIFYSSKKEGKDTWQSILGYFAKYIRILGQVS